MSSLVERVEINYPLEKDWLSCATVAPAFFSVSITYISSWCWLTSTYLNILICFSIEVLHHAFHLQKVQLNKKYCYIAGNFFPTACALIGYFEVTWHLTIKLFPAKISKRATLQNLWSQRVTVHCYLRMLTDDRSYIHRRNSWSRLVSLSYAITVRVHKVGLVCM